VRFVVLQTSRCVSQNTVLPACSGYRNPVTGTLKPLRNGPLYSSKDGDWYISHWLLHLVKKGLAWAGCGPQSSHCTWCSSPTVNDQCTNFVLL